MRYIYTRVSTDKQDTENQLHKLRTMYPDAVTIEETASGDKHRQKLESLLETLQRGDTLIIAALDRLGRRAGETVPLLDDLTRRGITLISVREGLDLSTIAGTLVAQILCAVAQLERSLISERTKAAIARRREKGLPIGPPIKFSESDKALVLSLVDGGNPYRWIAKQTGMSTGRISQLVKEKSRIISAES